MGTTAFRILMRTIVCIEFMQLYVMYTSPEIVHCRDCMDHEQCQGAWDSEWWRGFSRHLLHPNKILSPTGAMILLENVKIRTMCSHCLDAIVTAIVSSNILDYRNALINEGAQDTLTLMHKHCENRIIKPAAISEINDAKSD